MNARSIGFVEAGLEDERDIQRCTEVAQALRDRVVGFGPLEHAWSADQQQLLPRPRGYPSNGAGFDGHSISVTRRRSSGGEYACEFGSVGMLGENKGFSVAACR